MNSQLHVETVVDGDKGRKEGGRMSELVILYSMSPWS